ncbi:TetR family transcriptional regulator [Paroceanicella profunda]|uniref:TetR family transcriptional regulator n=1 Tax=Paroceanicella profunda TaxID=2579971 RepID=A0A5B8FSS4_9RHOB|nr:TetR family transcriptional regulator [Paroceanicella profunda]QDL90354.1 TetR family transcriptional regulator [Paroceanicella profunda]
MTDQPHRGRDPDRRERILLATLDVIASHGVAGTTHRRVAAAAGVPLGSMTYHFDGMEALLLEAFTRLATEMHADYASLLDAARSPAEAAEAVVEVISGGRIATPRNMQLVCELWAYTGRIPVLRTVMQGWLGQSRAALGRHFDAHTVHALDALVEGLTLHNMVDPQPLSRADVRAIVARLTS